jgi:hypothetical protein
VGQLALVGQQAGLHQVGAGPLHLNIIVKNKNFKQKWRWYLLPLGDSSLGKNTHDIKEYI